MTSDCNVFEFDVILQCNVFLVMRSLSSSTPFVECTLWSCYIRYVNYVLCLKFLSSSVPLVDCTSMVVMVPDNFMVVNGQFGRTLVPWPYMIPVQGGSQQFMAESSHWRKGRVY